MGTAVVLGSILAHLTNPTATSNPPFLFAGLAFLVIAIGFSSLTYWLKEYKTKNKSSKTNFRRGVLLSVFCGLAISMQAFPFNYAFEAGFDEYASSLFMCIGAFFCTLLLIPFLMRKSLIPGQEPFKLSEYRRAGKSWHGWAWLGALIWALGTMCNLVVAHHPSFSVAITFALGQCAPLIAVIWGIFVWKEFEGAPRKVYWCLPLMFLLYVLGIIFIAHATI
jgi:glucose uptake protein